MPSTAKKPAARTASAGKKKTTAAKKSSANTRTKTAAKKTTAKAQPAVRDQHREVWVVVTFFLSLILIFAMIGVDGGILTPLADFFKGLLGVGAYVLPISVLAVCVIIIFAHGGPIAAQITCTMLLPVFIGMLAHLIFSDTELTSHVIPTLYKTGKTWASGGVIAGGIAALMEAGINTVLSIIIVFICFTFTSLRCFNIGIREIIEFFVDIREESKEKRYIREEYKYENNEDLPKIHREPPKKPMTAEELHAAREAAMAADERRRQSLMNIPLDGEEQAKQEKKRKPVPKPVDLQPAPSEMPDIPCADEPLPLEDAMEIESSITAAAPAAISVNPEENVPEADMELSEPEIESFEEDSSSEPQPLTDDEILEELTGLESGLTEGMDFEMPGEDGETVDEPVFEELAPSSEPLIPAVLGAAANAQPVSEPEVVDTHQMVTDTVGSPIAQADMPLSYDYPPIELLREEAFVAGDDVSEELRTRSHKLEDTLQSFGVHAQIINVIRGPSVTRYEILLDRGVKMSRLTALQDDIALALGASGVRIAAIPDKSAVGIEVPNKVVQTVYLREVLTSRTMSEDKSKLAFALGKDITGSSIVGDISRMPHMLIAGTTGSGKSVCINSIIVSLIYRSSPEEVRLIMVDPKMVELGIYNGIPHLLVPVVTDYKKAAGALNWAVMEMERRYKRMFEYGARDLDSYNAIALKRGEESMPRIVIIIDELADLMMMAAKEIEESVCRIAQKARAAGMHLIIATQRPSADVLTGLMKSNIPSRIAFAVASQIESRIILDQNGAEKLIGRGDMLYAPLGIPKPLRVQGCFLSTGEVEAVAEYVKQSGCANYSQEIIDHMERSANADEDGGLFDDEEDDDRFDEAVDIVVKLGQASASMLQRKMKLGYSRAGRIIDQMESRGIVGPADGSKPRQVLLSRNDWAEMKSRKNY